MTISTPQLFEKLEQEILPKVLPGVAHNDNRAVAVSQFLPLLLTGLMNRAELPPSALAAGGSHILEQVFPDASHRNQITEQIALHNNIDQADVSRLMVDSTPLAAAMLQRESGRDGMLGFLNHHREGIIKRLPGWAEKLLPMLGLAVVPVVNHNTAPRPVPVPPPQSGFKKWLPLLALLALGLLALLLWKSCSSTTTDTVRQTAATTTTTTTPATSAITAPVAAAAAVPAMLSLSTGTGDTVYACRGFAGDEGLRSRLTDAITQVFGANKCTVVADQAYATAFPGDDKLVEVLGLVKAVPDATIDINGNNITVNAPDASLLAKLVNDIKALLPNMNVMAAAPLNVEQTVTQSVQDANTALQGLNVSSARPADIARALNLQIINFASDSDVIPDVNKGVLDNAATLIQQVPNVMLGIGGHTDSDGSDDYNINLSQRRADAVKNYLISKGVSAEKLTTRGYGETQPTASNATEQGKFRNRRIEFAVENTETGTVRTVNENTAAAGQPNVTGFDGTAIVSTDGQGNTSMTAPGANTTAVANAVAPDATATTTTVTTQTTPVTGN